MCQLSRCQLRRKFEKRTYICTYRQVKRKAERTETGMIPRRDAVDVSMTSLAGRADC